ncbi:MAG TPA: type II toxin-antitoxin system HicA family toxin [Chthoniobacterales bacterium]
MKIPRDVSGAKLAKALGVFGYEVMRQGGSHIRLTTEQNGRHHVPVQTIHRLHSARSPGVLKAIAAHHGLTLEEALQVLKL